MSPSCDWVNTAKLPLTWPASRKPRAPGTDASVLDAPVVTLVSRICWPGDAPSSRRWYSSQLPEIEGSSSTLGVFTPAGGALPVRVCRLNMRMLDFAPCCWVSTSVWPSMPVPRPACVPAGFTRKRVPPPFWA